MSDVPTIRLAGRDWPVPVLAPRQNRIVVPALLALIPKIAAAREEAARRNEGGIAALARYLDTTAYDTLTEISHLALTRAHPDLSRTAFDDMAIDTLELLAAVHTIARAAGLVRPETSPR